ncbi:MAG: leucyl aminopeptidase family protein, partial [Emcibacteraceae bacterium]|nr:leucyl aminopeptidase family protein [Emcibacteraceae bacterium]
MIFDVSADASANIAFGAKLGSYYFDKYYTTEERQKPQDSLTIIGSNDDAAEELFSSEMDPVANAMWHARDISNEPANIIYPESFVAQWTEHFKGMDNIEIKVIDENEMLELGMGAIYGVGRGSDRPPRMMIVEYNGAALGDEMVVVVGKGITFDTGGISLKNPTNMWNMKFDMSGAASAIGTIHALAGRGAKVNVVGIAALAENMPGSNAQRPGDVVTSMSGKTIQIRSTDAEGRLVLADAMYYGDTKYNPAFMVDLATLTGSARAALGSDYAALFSRHDETAQKLLEMGKITGDELWHMPLNKNHFKAIKNNVADVMNSGPSAPGASAGAAFVGEFVRETTNWAHLDIAGIAYSDSATPTKSSPGSRAFGVRLLNGYIKEHYEEK